MPGLTLKIILLVSSSYVSTSEGTSGLGPTKLISPFRIFINWGSSSKLCLFNNLPILSNLGSSAEVETYDEETKRIILSVKPGMTDLATLSNIHEGEILRGAIDPHEAYRRIIKPQKLSLAKQYVKNRSFWLDLKIILKTLKSAIF